MESNTYYMSIGYPLGLCEIEELERVFNIELNGEFIGLPLNSYNIWKYCFFDMKKLESIKETFDFKVEEVIENLISNKVLIKLDFNDIDSVFNRLKILTPVKNGFGVGLNENDKYEILNQGKPFCINSDQFRLWGECDNRKMNKVIFEKLLPDKNNNKEAKIYFINMIITLKMLDLIRLNKREKVQ